MPPGGRPPPRPAPRRGGLGGRDEPVSELIRRAIALANSVADGVADEEVTPSEIAEPIRDALVSTHLESEPQVRRYLNEALDAVSDGMPPDYTVMILYSALGRLQG
jgi:hypothetical protein